MDSKGEEGTVFTSSMEESSKINRNDIISSTDRIDRGQAVGRRLSHLANREGEFLEEVLYGEDIWT